MNKELLERMEEDLVKVLSKYAGWISNEEWFTYLKRIRQVCDVENVTTGG